MRQFISADLFSLRGVRYRNIGYLGLVLLLVVLAQVSKPETAFAASNGGYPDWNMPCIAPGGVSYGKASGSGYWCNGYRWGSLVTKAENSARGYGYRNCTDWVAWRVQGYLGKSPTGLGNAYSWDNNAAAKGYRVTNAPEPGQAAVWNSGHVAFVESVNSNGTTNISEYNRSMDGNYGTRGNIRADVYVDFDGVGVNKFTGGSTSNDSDNDGVSDSQDKCPHIAGSINGCPDGQPLVAAVMNTNGTGAAYTRGADGRVYTSWQNSFGSTWEGWAPLGDIRVVGAPIASINPLNGAHAIYARGTNNHAYTAWQPHAGSGTWLWADLGGDIYSNLELSETIMGTGVLFARNSRGELIHSWQPSVGSTWTGWYSLGGGFVGDPEIMRNSNGSLAAFVRGTDNQLWHKWQLVPGGTWSDWANLGGNITSSPSFVMNNDGIGVVFARDVSGSITHTWQYSPGSSWRSWESLNTPKTNSGVTVTKEAGGSLTIYYVREDGQLMTDWQWAAGSGWYRSPIGATAVGTPGMLRNHINSTMSQYAPSNNGYITTTWQNYAGSTWTGPANVGRVLLTSF